MKLVMFDIDGTLTETNRVDEECYVQALLDEFSFRDIDTDWSRYPHCSDSGILETIFRGRRRRSPHTEEIARFQERFTMLLTQAASVQPFREIGGAATFLSRLLAEECSIVALASGGWRATANLKLASAGLDLRQLPAAFADDGCSREEIMRMAMTRAADACGRRRFDSVTYVGDGVWDARAARNLNYRFIGIAREPVKRDRLYEEGACDVFADFYDVPALMTALDEC
jgi:phosphoglycolate phosphatase-like HAD superfamily hydrolase